MTHVTLVTNKQPATLNVLQPPPRQTMSVVVGNRRPPCTLHTLTPGCVIATMSQSNTHHRQATSPPPHTNSTGDDNLPPQPLATIPQRVTGARGGYRGRLLPTIGTCITPNPLCRCTTHTLRVDNYTTGGNCVHPLTHHVLADLSKTHLIRWCLTCGCWGLKPLGSSLQHLWDHLCCFL